MERNRARQQFLTVNEKILNHIVLLSIRRGLAYMIPLIFPGSFALILLSLPIPAYQSTMTSVFGSEWQAVFTYVRDGTFNILSLIMAVSIGYSYANEYSVRKQYINPLITSLVSLSCLSAFIGISRENFLMSSLGAEGIFTSLMVGIISSQIFVKLSSLKLLKIRAFTDGTDSSFHDALTTILPAVITVTIFGTLNHLLSSVFGITSTGDFISGLLVSLFSKINSPFLGGILFIFLIHLLWIFGIHGSNVLESTAQRFFEPGIAVNEGLIQNGLPPTEIFTKTFFDTFVLMGGCGTVLCLLLVLLFASRHKNRRRLAKISFFPVFFNINELIIFGLPVVLNPVFIIPFLCVPLFLTLISYLAMRCGFVPLAVNQVEWTTPILLSGYSATGSLRGSFLQIINLLIGIGCYFPFVRLSEYLSDAQARYNLERLNKIIKEEEEKGLPATLLRRQDEVGVTSRLLLSELENDLSNHNISLFYQPQVSYNGSITGMEGLLRWNHYQYGLIYSPLVIALAEEAGLIDSLGEWIINQACSDMKKLHDLGIYIPSIAVNISVMQLEDILFIDKLKSALEAHQIKPFELEIEITERIALSGSSHIHKQMMAIKELGVRLSMDDFGMGHSSLLYLKEGYFNTVKLDGSLTKELLSNDTCRNIVSSIAELGKSLNYSLVAEYVEYEEQKDILHELGCNNYQGYLYSKAMPFEDALNFIKNTQYGR